MSTATAVKISAREEGTLITGVAPMELGQRAWRGLLRTRACLVKRLDAELEQAHGLPTSSYEVLHHLAQAGSGRMRMRDLAEQAQLSRSGLTRLVDRLERDGLLHRLQLAGWLPSDKCHRDYLLRSMVICHSAMGAIIKSKSSNIKS